MTAKQKKAIAALLAAPTVQAAAKETNISYSTLRRWLKYDNDFRLAYQDATSQIIEEAAMEARRNITPALQTLRRISEDEESPAAVKVTAAKATLEYGLRLTERMDLLDRIEKLEESMERDQ